MGNKALFLDRDGTINIVGPNQFVHKPEYFHFINGIFGICREAQEKGYKIIVITNQTGIGKGDYTEEDMKNVHRHMRKAFEKEGVEIDDIFYTKYPSSPNRKPNPGMFLLAKTKYELNESDMQQSISIGDRKKDAEAALGAGVGTVVYFQNNEVLNENWKRVFREPQDVSSEIAELHKKFEFTVKTIQTLVILGALSQVEDFARKPQIIAHHTPELWVIDKYKQLEGRL